MSQKRGHGKRKRRKRRYPHHQEQQTKKIFCMQCGKNIKARLTNGKEIYPYRKNLSSLPFWICDTCGNYVGCHHKTEYPTKPLGCIPNAHMRRARNHIHKLIDEILNNTTMSRRQLYRMISKFKGSEYHTAELRDIEEARTIYRFLLTVQKKHGH